MKFYKKLVVAATAATMVFGTVGSAFAAVNVGGTAFADVKADDKAAGAFNVLAALGVYEGNEGIGGNVRPDSTITREEFSAVVVRFLDKDSTAKSLNTYVPSFTDASKISSWAWGYVNVASSLGIVNGYPNGEFRPQNPVTHAEAIAMLTRAVNVDKAATGVWPLNYVVLGGTVGITDDVDIVANVPATRAEVAQMTRNGYDVEHKWNSDDEKLEKTGIAFGDRELDLQVDGVVKNVSTSKIEIDKSREWAASAYVIGVDRISDLVNLEVSAFLNKDGEVVAVVVDDEDTTTESGILDTEDELAEGRLVIDGKRYRDFADKVSVYLNNGNKATDVTGEKAIEKLAELLLDNADKDIYDADVTASVSMNKSNEVTSVRVTVADVYGFLTDVDEDDRSIIVDGNEVDVVSGTAITLNGKTVTLLDLEKAFEDFEDEYDGDSPWAAVATKGASGDKGEAYRLDVYTTTITGTVQGRGKSGKKDTVTLDVDGSRKTVTISNAEASGIKDAASLSGTVTLLLNEKEEAVFDLKASTEANTFVARVRGWTENRSKEVTSVRLQVASDVTEDYDVDIDDEDRVGRATAATLGLTDKENQVVKVEMKDGFVFRVVALGGADAEGKVDRVTSSLLRVDDKTAGLKSYPLSDNILVKDEKGDYVSFSRVRNNWTVKVYLDSNEFVSYVEQVAAVVAPEKTDISNYTISAERDEDDANNIIVTVTNVPNKAKVTVYDHDGNELASLTRNDAVHGTTLTIDVADATGDMEEVHVTVTEDGKDESDEEEVTVVED